MNQMIGDCWEWTDKPHHSGYCYFYFKNSDIPATLISWFIYKDISKPLTGVICHFCNNKKCVNPQHLYQTTQVENMQYAMRCNGSKNSTLDLKTAIEIRKDYKINKVSQVSLAKKYKVHTNTIWRIIAEETWHE